MPLGQPCCSHLFVKEWPLQCVCLYEVVHATQRNALSELYEVVHATQRNALSELHFFRTLAVTELALSAAGMFKQDRLCKNAADRPCCRDHSCSAWLYLIMS